MNLVPLESYPYFLLPNQMFLVKSLFLYNQESLDFIKTTFSQETFDWVKENMDEIIEELDS